MPVECLKANSRINQREEKSEEKLSRGYRNLSSSQFQLMPPDPERSPQPAADESRTFLKILLNSPKIRTF